MTHVHTYLWIQFYLGNSWENAHNLSLKVTGSNGNLEVVMEYSTPYIIIFINIFRIKIICNTLLTSNRLNLL